MTDLAAPPALPLPPSPVGLGERLAAVYRRFYDSAYSLSEPGLRDERRRMLDAGEHLAIRTLLEPVPGYASSGLTVEQAAMGLPGLTDELRADVGEFLAPLMAGNELYEHQARRSAAVIAGGDLGGHRRHRLREDRMRSCCRPPPRWSPSRPTGRAPGRPRSRGGARSATWSRLAAAKAPAVRRACGCWCCTR